MSTTSSPLTALSTPSPPIETEIQSKKTTRKRKTKIETNDIVIESETIEVEVETQKRKRRKKEKEPVMPLAPRILSTLKIGAHVSAAKGVENAVTNAVHIGYTPF